MNGIYFLPFNINHILDNNNNNNSDNNNNNNNNNDNDNNKNHDIDDLLSLPYIQEEINNKLSEEFSFNISPSRIAQESIRLQDEGNTCSDQFQDRNSYFPEETQDRNSYFPGETQDRNSYFDQFQYIDYLDQFQGKNNTHPANYLYFIGDEIVSAE